MLQQQVAAYPNKELILAGQRSYKSSRLCSALPHSPHGNSTIQRPYPVDLSRALTSSLDCRSVSRDYDFERASRLPLCGHDGSLDAAHFFLLALIYALAPSCWSSGTRWLIPIYDLSIWALHIVLLYFSRAHYLIFVGWACFHFSSFFSVIAPCLIYGSRFIETFLLQLIESTCYCHESKIDSHLSTSITLHDRARTCGKSIWI